METNKRKQKRGEIRGTENEGEEKGYMRWALHMERSLANILRDQRNMGNKGDSGWKTRAFNTASSLLSSQFDKDITPNNVRNCVKTWKRNYAVVSDILAQSEFNWDFTKHMLVIDNEDAWNEFTKSHEDAKKFRWKVIPNWDDIEDLCGKDRASGVAEVVKDDPEDTGKDKAIEGVETALDDPENINKNREIGSAETAQDDPENVSKHKAIKGTNTVMVFLDDPENVNKDGEIGGAETALDDPENISSSSVRSQKRKNPTCSTSCRPSKKGGLNSLASAVMKMASTLQEFVRFSIPKIDVGEVYEEVYSIPDLDEVQQMKACICFLENEKQFLLLKRLPIEKKKKFISLLI